MTLPRVRYPAHIFIRAGENSSRFRRGICYTASAIRSIEQNPYGVVHHFQVYQSSSCYVSVYGVDVFDCHKDEVEATS